MRPAPARSEIAVVDLQVCDRCGLCLPLCPPEAIHLQLTDLLVDRATCTGCRKCIAPCAGGGERWRARIAVGADGVEAMVGRWAGLDTRVPARDMESCAQYVLEGIDFDPDAIYLQFGEQIAPGGYAWLFPKGPGIANVGLGLVALKADGRNARQYLDEWIARRYPGG